MTTIGASFGALPDVVILDEFGYIPLDVDGARLLFQVISESYESKSMTLTTNIEFGGQSRRFEEALMMGRSEDWGNWPCVLA